MPKTISVKLRNHFKVDVYFKDVQLFENELKNNNLDFYVENGNEPSLVHYYLLNKDKSTVDSLLEESHIVANYDTLQLTGLNQERNFMKLYLRLVGVFIFSMLLLKTVDFIVNP